MKPITLILVVKLTTNWNTIKGKKIQHKQATYMQSEYINIQVVVIIHEIIRS